MSAGPDLTATAGRRSAAKVNLLFASLNSSVVLASGLVLVPIYLRSFDLATYGAWLATGNVLSLVGILDLGLGLVLSQRLAEMAGRSDADSFSRTATAGLLLTLISAAAIVGVCFGVSSWVPRAVNAPPGQWNALAVAFRLAALGGAAVLVQMGLGAIAQAWQRSTAPGLASVLGSLLGVIVTVVALLLGCGVVSLGWGALARGVAGATLLGADTLKEWKARRLPMRWHASADMGTLVRATLPVFLGRAGGVALGNSEAALVSILVNPAAAAVLSLSTRLFSLSGMLLSPVGSAAFAGIARLSVEGGRDRVEKILGELFDLTGAVSGFLLGSLVALNPGFVALWVGPGRFGGLPLSAVACIAASLASRLGTGSLVLTALGLFRQTALVSVAEASARILLVFMLVPSLSILGMPVAAIASSLGVSGWYLWHLFSGRFPGGGDRRVLLMRGWPTVAVPIALGVAGAAVLPQPHSWPMFVALASGVGFVQAAAVLATGRSARRLLASHLRDYFDRIHNAASIRP